MKLLVLGAFFISAQISYASDLAKKSPFLPPGYGVKVEKPPKPVAPTQGPISREIEFRGIIQMGDTYKFSIFSKKEKKGDWITEGKASETGITVSGFDEKSSTVIVNMNGRVERLTLMKATDSPLPVPQIKAASKNNNNSNNALPPQQNKQTQNNAKRTIPRRRVILPNKK
ncbi:MAG: hypothetical protein AAF065_14150 [Verrucomicrobiota bacterium]